MVCRNQSRAYVVAVIAALAGLIACGQSAARGDESGAEKKIREALAKPTRIEFNETQFKDAVQYLADTHEINIEVDWLRIQDAPTNVGPDRAVTRVLKGTSLASALNLLLGDLGVTYIIENEVLLITSIEKAQRTSTPRIYDLAGSVREADRDLLPKAVELVLDPPVVAADGKPLPTSSRMLAFGDKLILRGSQPEHERVSKLLSKLRESPKKPAAEPEAAVDAPVKKSSRLLPRGATLGR